MSTSLYLGTERRKSARTIAEAIIYISVEPNNGGVISNISEGGLCFHLAGPVHLIDALRFCCLLKGRRIQIDGKLAWTNDTKKKGGLQFNSLPPEMYEQLRDWTHKSTALSIAQKPAPSAPKTQGFRALGAAQSRRSSAPVSSVPLRGPLLEKRAELLLPGFFHGFFAGLVIAALLLAAFFGGERFTTKSTDRLGSLAHNPMSSPRLQLPLVPLRQGDQSQQAKLEPAATPTAAPLLGVSGYASENGFIVTTIDVGSPADTQAHIEVRDVIVSVAGQPVNTAQDIELALGKSAMGTVTISYLMQGRYAIQHEIKVR